MASDILWVLIISLFVIPGLKHPYLALCGAVFVEIVTPQSLSYSFLAGKPVSFGVLMFFFTSLLLNMKKLSIPRKKLSTGLILFLMAWITLSTFNAEFQSAAWIKYDYVIKLMILPVFIPFILNSRVKIDTFIAVMVCSIGFFTIVLGVKFLVGGHGYGQQFIYSTLRNTGITESSTMAMMSVLNLPFIFYLSRYSIFKDRIILIKPASYFLGLTSISSAIATYARTGLVGLFVWLMLLVKESKYRIRYFFLSILCLIVIFPFVPEDWINRMETTTEASTEASALGRLVVWRWTIDYVNERPLMGGGFHSYLANEGRLDSYVKEDIDVSFERAKAFHSIYFEVLGELGYVGLFVYLWIIYLGFSMNRALEKDDNSPEWAVAQARARKQVIIIYCACGMFIGVAYYPWLFYLLGLAASLDNVCNTESCEAIESGASRKNVPVSS